MNDLSFRLKALAGLAGLLWGALAPVIQVLLGMMALDIGTGVMAAIMTGTLSSKASWRGVAGKAMVIMLVVAVGLLQSLWEHYSGITITLPTGTDLSLSEAVAAAYIVHEIISILENADRAKIWIPGWLRAGLAQLHRQQESP